MTIIGKFVGCRCSQIIQPAAVGWRSRPLSQHLKNTVLSRQPSFAGFAVGTANNNRRSALSNTVV